jgi:hypothetical protein
MNKSDLGPVFIGGPDRCGKTTLRAFLVSHPNISIPAVGTNMWTFFYQQYGDLSRKENFERCLDAMLHYKHVAFLKPDAERIRREFWQGKPTYARLFALFQQHHAEREGKPRWGDQTGLIERYAGEVFAAYPTAKMIHMVRDPRDRYEASLALWPDGKGRAGGAAARWMYSVNLARKNLQRFPDRYLIVQFEEMVLQTEQVLRKVCDFLGEDFVPGMLTMEGAPDHRNKLARTAQNTNGASPLSASFIGKYRQTISKYEIAFIQNAANEELRVFNYPIDKLNFSPAEKLYYGTYTLPVNLLRMTGWRLVETIQHNFPAYFGRKPRGKMSV